MKTFIQLTSQMSGGVVYFNPKYVSAFAEYDGIVSVCGPGFILEAKEPWEEVRKRADGPGFLEFVWIKRMSRTKRLLIKASAIAEVHEQDGGVLLQLGGCGGFLVQGTLEDVTEKIEKALEEGV